MAMKSKSADLSILNVDILELTKQICLKDLELFKAIPIEEIEGFHWTKACKKNLCPNIMMFTKQFNKINFWVQKQILDNVNTSTEVTVLSKFIKLSQCLLEYCNFQSAYAIKAALDSTSIHRLEQLWSRLSKKYLTIWEKMCSVFCVEDNYQNLRNAMLDSKLPVIPFIGVYLGDLTGLDAAFPKVDGKSTDLRTSNMEKIFDLIVYYQYSKYDFKIHHGIQDYLHSMEYMEEFENLMLDNYFILSKELEPDAFSKLSNSSLTNNINVPQIQVLNSSPLVTRKSCPDKNSCNSLRLRSEKDRKLCPLMMPGSPRLLGRNVRSMSPDWEVITTRNLLDDSEVLPQNGNNITFLNRSLHHANSTASLSSASGGLFGLSPTINLYNQFSSFRRPDIETKSYVQYKDPDILTSTNQNVKLVLAGLVKRKIKSRQSFDLSRYQKVLAKLFIEKVDCYINFYLPKSSKMKSIDDFKDECLATISIIDAELNYDNLITDPKIYITLYHDTYVLKSIDNDTDNWPTIDKWWKSISESKSTVSQLKAALCQPEDNLINLVDEFTRL